MARVSPRPGTAPTIAVLLAVFAAVRAGLGAESMPNSSKECAICHIRWVGAFDRNGARDAAMEAATKQQAGSGDMCLSCHDGSVADSRFKVWSTSHHTTDAVPSAAVRIPTDQFPLDDQGRMTCATCHTAHAVPNSSDLRTVVFLRRPNVDSSLCLSCHPEHARRNDFQHPLGHTESPVPAAILQAGGKAAEDGHGIICQTCHEPHGARNAWMLVLPPSELCVACHTRKNPESAPPAGAPVHRIGHTYPGFKPPASLLAEKASFGPMGELSCLSCHRLHDASGARPLLIRKNQESSLCLDCHPQERTILGSPHDLRVSSSTTRNAKGQEASVSGPCGACHRIHGWARDVPDTGRPHSSGCLECHQAEGPGAVHRPYVEAHPVGVPLPDGVSVSLPVDADTNAIGCLTCHDPHVPRRADDAPSVTVASAETHPGLQPPRSFLRAEGSQLCVLCHQETAAHLGDAHDPARFGPAVRNALAVNPSIGSCRVCHTTHNARGMHLWARAPANSSGGPLSNLCLACHDQSLLSEPGGTHHPMAVASSFQNLSDSLRVGTAAQSRAGGEIGCLTCHDPHTGSEQAAQPHETSTALCTSCHVDKRGVIGSVHDPATADWGKKLGFASEGVCLDCHPIHGPEQESALQTALGRANAGQQLCQACHQSGSPGPTAETPHMGRTLAPPADGVSPHAPVPFVETISCGTCHDIHQGPQPAKLLRGHRQKSDLCLSCHPQTRGLPGSPHDLRRSAPEATNLHGETADESGPCSACHLIHPAARANGSWAHAGLSGRDFGAGYCTGCHQAGGCAAAGVPGHTDHPDVPILNRTRIGDPDYRPTFDENGKPSRDGVISCLTCHEPHGMSAPPQAGKDGMSQHWMFLRPAARQSLCVDCHGMETPWRFLYFHRANRNPRPPRGSERSQHEP